MALYSSVSFKRIAISRNVIVRQAFYENRPLDDSCIRSMPLLILGQTLDDSGYDRRLAVNRSNIIDVLSSRETPSVYSGFELNKEKPFNGGASGAHVQVIGEINGLPYINRTKVIRKTMQVSGCKGPGHTSDSLLREAKTVGMLSAFFRTPKLLVQVRSLPTSLSGSGEFVGYEMTSVGDIDFMELLNSHNSDGHIDKLNPHLLSILKALNSSSSEGLKYLQTKEEGLKQWEKDYGQRLYDRFEHLNDFKLKCDEVDPFGGDFRTLLEDFFEWYDRDGMTHVSHIRKTSHGDPTGRNIIFNSQNTIPSFIDMRPSEERDIFYEYPRLIFGIDFDGVDQFSKNSKSANAFDDFFEPNQRDGLTDWMRQKVVDFIFEHETKWVEETFENKMKDMLDHEIEDVKKWVKNSVEDVEIKQFIKKEIELRLRYHECFQFLCDIGSILGQYTTHEAEMSEEVLGKNRYLFRRISADTQMFRHGFEKLKKARNKEFDDETDLGDTSTESVGHFDAASESETDCGSVSFGSFNSFSQEGSSRSFPSLSSIGSVSSARNKINYVFPEPELDEEQETWFVDEKDCQVSKLGSNPLFSHTERCQYTSQLIQGVLDCL